MNIFETNFNFKKRLSKVRKLMDERNIDVFLSLQWPNQYYLSGFYQHLPWYPLCHAPHTEAPLMIFREKSEDPIFLCQFLTYNAVKEGTWIKDVRAFNRKSTKSVHEYTAQILKDKGLESSVIGLEEDCCTIKTFESLQKYLPKVQFKQASDVFYLARVVKEPEEIELIRKAVSIAEAAINVAMEVAKPGVTEMEVLRAAEMEMKRRGCLREIESMFQSGKRTANYRAFSAEWKKVEINDIALMDIGCIYKGYGSDVTRAWVIGEATLEQKKIAKDLYNLQEKMFEFIKPGIKCHEAADYAQRELLNAGYSTSNLDSPHQRRYSIHGIGLGPFHELPDVEHKDIALEPGMTFALQPSIRHKEFTIRFEDNAVLTPNGIELLTTLPREFI
jgi:Xaa-Pro aminopeptidase